MKYEKKRRDIKVIVSGEVVEFYEYSIPISVEKREHKIIKGTKAEEEGKREDNLSRARQQIRRYIWQNITTNSKFITLTYKETCLDYDKLVKDFKIFLIYLKRKGYKTDKWLYVTEHQKERGIKEGNEGSLHIHCVLFFDDFIPYSVINECWRQGSTDIHKIDSVNNLGAYVCKYLTKDEFTLYEKNSYHISRGLKKPLELCHDGYITDYEFQKELLNSCEWNYINTREVNYIAFDGSDFHNTVIYKQGRIKK